MLRDPHDRRGFTLIELLVVMGIIALIAGVGVGMVRRRDKTLGLEVNAKLVRATIREARNAALGSGAGSIIRFDVENASFEAAVVERGGDWHFEDDSGSRNTKIKGALEFDPEGKLGKCLKLGGGEIDLGNYPWYGAVNGMLFSLWIKPDALATGLVLAREQTFSLKMREDGGLNGEMRVGAQRETVVVETRSGLLEAGRWRRITFAYDRAELRIEVDGVLRALKKETRPIATFAGGRLTLGGQDGVFKGRMDEARYEVTLDGEETRLQFAFDFLPASDRVIIFDGSGQLDPRFHEKAARIIVATDPAEEGGEPAQDAIVVELTGAIR